jgi:hypothetical protein
MKKIVVRETRQNKNFLFFHCLYLLIHTDSEKLIWPNSPFLVLLQFVDPNVLSGPDHEALQEGESRCTLLHHLARMADPTRSDYLTQENQLTLGRQLIEHGANVNVLSFPYGNTPLLHHACNSAATTNLDFIQLLLENGEDPNTQDFRGLKPLMYTANMAPGAAKFLLEWPTTDVNIATSSGASFLAYVRGGAIKYFADKVAQPEDNPDRLVHTFVYQQWCAIEKMPVERA